jgi:SNF2 family DNA or RNA helicase
MIGAGDIKGAIARIGGGTTNESNLFDIVSRKQKEKLLSAKFSLEMWTARPNSAKEIEMGTKRLKEIDTTLSELEEKYKKVLEDDCSICYSTISAPVLLPCCQNIFCGKCIITWFETTKTCPMCRSVIKTKELVYINKEKKEEEKKDDVKEDKPMQKHETVLSIVEQGLKKKKKFLIFSMFDESFSIIRRGLDEHKIDFVEISGSKASRDLKIKKFREGKVNVVFLNSRFNGAGINLETASDIILYHEMPSAIREQVVGRALRIGREGDLVVHNLVY